MFRLKANSTPQSVHSQVYPSSAIYFTLFVSTNRIRTQRVDKENIFTNPIQPPQTPHSLQKYLSNDCMASPKSFTDVTIPHMIHISHCCSTLNINASFVCMIPPLRFYALQYLQPYTLSSLKIGIYFIGDHKLQAPQHCFHVHQSVPLPRVH